MINGARAAIREWLFADIRSEICAQAAEIALLRADNARLEGETQAAALDTKVMRDRLRRPNVTLQQAVATVAYKWLDFDKMSAAGCSPEEKVGQMTLYFCAGLTEEMPALAATPAPATVSSHTGVMPANPTEGTTP